MAADNVRQFEGITRAGAITAAELSRDQVAEISIALRKSENEKGDLVRQLDRLRRENTELARRIGELTVLRKANAETILAVALHRKDLRVAFRNPEAVTITTRQEDYREGETRREFVSLADAIDDRLGVSLLAWITDVLNGGSITLDDEGGGFAR